MDDEKIEQPIDTIKPHEEPVFLVNEAVDNVYARKCDLGKCPFGLYPRTHRRCLVSK
jgi:hypothetical protein